MEVELIEVVDYVFFILLELEFLIELIKVEFKFIFFCKLGGDCFDYYWLDENYLVVYLLDVVGYGLWVVFFLVLVLNLLRLKVIFNLYYYKFSDVFRVLNNIY